jgi:hypothetical protein
VRPVVPDMNLYPQRLQISGPGGGGKITSADLVAPAFHQHGQCGHAHAADTYEMDFHLAAVESMKNEPKGSDA